MIARLASSTDIAELVRLRRLMFDSMGVEATDTAWVEASAAYLAEHLGGARVFGVVVDHPEGPGLVSTGLCEVLERIPGAQNVQGRIAYISSMSTDVEFRRRGCARAVLTFLLDEVRRRGITVVDLHATEEGAGLYRQLGFAPRPQPELRRHLG